MKKVFALSLMMVIALSLSAFSAVKGVKPASNPAPAPAAAVSGPQGFVGVTLNSIGCPSARFGMGTWSLDVGGSLTSAGGTTTTTILAKGDIPMADITGDLRTYFAPQVLLNSAGGTSTTTLSLLLGAEYTFAPHLTIFADLTAFTLTSVGGTSTWTVGQNAGQIYTGARLYI